MTQDLFQIKQELVVFLRNKDIISTSNRGVTTSQDTGSYSNDSTDTLDTNPTLVKNVRNIAVGGTDLVFGTEYSVNYDTGVITYVSAQTGNYVIDYDQGNTDSIYPDFPQPYLKLNQFPRIAVDIIGGNMSEISLGATTSQHSYNITIVGYSATTEELEDLIKDVQSNVLSNKKNFYYLSLIHPTTLGPILNSPNKEDKVMQRNIDFLADFNFETV